MQPATTLQTWFRAFTAGNLAGGGVLKPEIDTQQAGEINDERVTAIKEAGVETGGWKTT